MTRSKSVFCLAILLLTGSAPAGSLRVDPSGRYFVDGGGTPFFFLGDTATRMNHMLDRADMDLYFSTRASQGFTVVLASAFRGHAAEYPKPNAYGEWPFINDIITQPDIHGGYDYWDHIDYMIDTAGSYGLTVALVAYAIGWDGGGYRYLDASNAYAYGSWIGQRYVDRSNVVWVLGWDNPIDSPGEDAIWNEMGRGIKDATGGSALITFHTSFPWPQMDAGSSSQWFHNAPWLDFNMVQAPIDAVHSGIERDYNLWPPKPTGLGEGPYEQGGDALTTRRAAYFSYLAGGYHVSGNLAIWGFGETGDWKAALNSPSAWQMSYLRNLFTSRPWWKYVPDQSVIASGAGWGATINAAARSTDGDGIIAYLSSSTTVAIDLGRISAGSSVDASWFDPTTGGTTSIGNFPNSGTQSFSTPGGWEDAVLLLDASGGSPGTFALAAAQGLAVSWTAPAGQTSANDWIGLYPTGAADDDWNSLLWWQYTGGATSGSATVPPPYNGTFEFRYFLNDGLTKVATSNPVTVGSGGLSWTSAINGWGPVEVNASNGEDAAGDGGTITLNGVTYATGLGVHAYSEIRYPLGGSYVRFVSDIGVDDEVGSNGSVVFQVWVDGALLYDSGIMTGDSPTQTVDVDLTGRAEAVLIVTDAADGFDWDHADWAGAQFFGLLSAKASSSTSAPGGSSSGARCGATGMEVLLWAAILLLRRRRRV